MTPLTTCYEESPLGSCHQGGTFETTVKHNDDKSNRQKKAPKQLPVKQQIERGHVDEHST